MDKNHNLVLKPKYHSFLQMSNMQIFFFSFFFKEPQGLKWSDPKLVSRVYIVQLL